MVRALRDACVRRYGLVEDEAGEGPDGAGALPADSDQIDGAEEDMEVDHAEVPSFTLFRYMRASHHAAHHYSSCLPWPG